MADCGAALGVLPAPWQRASCHPKAMETLELEARIAALEQEGAAKMTPLYRRLIALV